jgi:hypothetical protein
MDMAGDDFIGGIHHTDKRSGNFFIGITHGFKE